MMLNALRGSKRAISGMRYIPGFMALVFLGSIGATVSEAVIYSGTGKWETIANWDTGDLPAGTDTVVVENAEVTFDDTTWVVLSEAGKLHSSTEYRLSLLRIANTSMAIVTFDFSNDYTIRTVNPGLSYIGSGNNSDGTVNLHSGKLIIESNTLAVGEKSGSTGLLNITGGTYIVSRESGGNSVNLGTIGSGTIRVSGGIFQTRAGLTLGSNGTFDVRGSGITEIGIGSNSSLDGRWVQQAGGILSVGIDACGVTPIVIDEIGDDGGGDVLFEGGAILHPYNLGGAPANQWYTVMTWEGTMTNNGLGLSPEAVASGWQFRIDEEASSLQVMLVPEPGAVGVLGLSMLAGVLRRRRTL